MKNKIAYLLFFAVLVATAGCNKKFLEDMKSYDKFTESIFTNEIQTGYYIDRLYKDYFGAYTSPTKTLVGLYDDTRRGYTEEFGGISNWINPNKNFQNAADADGYYTQNNPGSLPTSIRNDPYTRIRNANILLEQIDTLGVTLSADFKKTAKGQMFMFRALQYFDLARVYGGVPIELEVHEASFDNEAIKTPRAKSSEVFDQIIRDLDSAAYYLPLKWANQGADFGRFNRAAALAMKSRVLLTAASPLFNPNWDNPSDAHWQKALAASLAALDSLKTDYGKSITNATQWGEFTYKTDNVFNGEGIFVVPISNTILSNAGTSNGWENSIRPTEQKGSGGIFVPKGMIDLFPMADGSRPVIGTNYNDTFFFEGRDPRFYRTFDFSGLKWGVKGNPNKSAWFYRWKDASNKVQYANQNTTIASPVLVRKFSNPLADSTAYSFSGTDIYDFRYAELLLITAECYAATGDLANCATYLGLVRKRVYPAANNVDNYGLGFTFPDKYTALEAVLYERRVELAYEGKRFWDMQRWMLYDDDAAIGDNTNALLNVAKLNGTNRNGYYWQSKTNADPLTAADKALQIDPDASTFATDIQKLKTLVQTKFTMTPLDKAMDLDGSNPVNVLFRSNYYLSGFKADLLGNNPWLPQTKGWKDYSGALGTFDYQQ